MLKHQLSRQHLKEVNSNAWGIFFEESLSEEKKQPRNRQGEEQK